MVSSRVAACAKTRAFDARSRWVYRILGGLTLHVDLLVCRQVATAPAEPGADAGEAFSVSGRLRVEVAATHRGHLALTWQGDGVSDMIADAALAVVLQVRTALNAANVMKSASTFTCTVLRLFA